MEGSITRQCSRCRQAKPFADFGRRRRGGFQPYCRPCQAAYHREHYQKNTAAYMAAAKRRMQRMKEIVRAAKDQPCADCGRRYPYYVMDLDHREGEEKTANVNRLVWDSERTLRAEIAKCDVVCANCHRERTHQRSRQATAEETCCCSSAVERVLGKDEVLGSSPSSSSSYGEMSLSPVPGLKRPAAATQKSRRNDG